MSGKYSREKERKNGYALELAMPYEAKQMWNFVFLFSVFNRIEKKQKPFKMKDNRRRHLLSTQQTPLKRKRQRFNRSVLASTVLSLWCHFALFIGYLISFRLWLMAMEQIKSKVWTHTRTAINSKFDISREITSHTRRRHIPQLINHIGSLGSHQTKRQKVINSDEAIYNVPQK